MSTLVIKSLDLRCLLAAGVFVAHIVANLTLSRPANANAKLASLENLSLFPPAWVFAIWLVIWGLQSVLLVQTYGTGFWTWPTTALFLFICFGNIGSQLAGARDWGSVTYLLLLGGMFVASVLFLLNGQQNPVAPPVFPAAGQLYVGWASVAMVVGLGAVLVCEQQVVSDAAYSWVGLGLLVAVPVVIWTLWSRGLADYRVVAAPYLLVLVALALRVAANGGRFLRT